jgi:predicted membrane protein
VGAALVVIGALLLGDAVGLFEAGGVIADWWPVLLIALGLMQAHSGGGFGVVSTVLVAGGLALLGVTTGLFGEDIGDVVWAIVLIAAGAWVLLGWGRRRSPVSADSEVSGLSVFNVVKLKNRSSGLRSGSLTAVLGTLRLDLTGATLDAAGARVSATAVLGAVDIIVPKGWQVEVRGFPIFGGWDDTTSKLDQGADSPRLRVQALVILGGLEVKHPSRWI